jgi:hypothetical protein
MKPTELPTTPEIEQAQAEREALAKAHAEENARLNHMLSWRTHVANRCLQLKLNEPTLDALLELDGSQFCDVAGDRIAGELLICSCDDDRATLDGTKPIYNVDIDDCYHTVLFFRRNEFEEARERLRSELANYQPDTERKPV